MSEKEPFLAPSMTQWTTRLATYGLSSVAIGVDQGRFKAMEVVERLGLPHNRWSVIKVNDFLQNPDEHTANFPTERRFTVLASKKPHTLRFRQRGLDADGIVQLINSSLTKEMISDYHVILEDSPVYTYGGNIVCSKSGAVRLEMNAGKDGQSEIVGGKQPEFIAERDLLSGLFKHSYEDETLRRAVWRTIMTIPSRFQTDHAAEYMSREIEFHPGYYEFYLDEQLRPLFIDYTDESAFIDLPDSIH
jgi:hypothetical protein